MTAVKTRKLSDLYRRGKEFTLTDDSEDEAPVVVWLQKLNPVESETATRAANAARARHMMAAKDHESDAYLSVLNDILDYSKEDLASFLAGQEMAKVTEALEAEFAEEKGWNDDDYLQGLHDAWEEGGLKERFHEQTEDAPDEEAQNCFAEMQRFQDELSVRFEAEEKNFNEEFMAKPIEVLQELMADRMVRLQSDMAWLIEFRKSELWMGVREPGHHKKRVFANRIEVDELEAETIGKLIEAYASLNVPVTQGKDSQPIPDSSPQSDPVETLETEESSGLVGASQ